MFLRCIIHERKSSSECYIVNLETGISSAGKTREEAKARIEEAFQAYFEALKEASEAGERVEWFNPVPSYQVKKTVFDCVILVRNLWKKWKGGGPFHPFRFRYGFLEMERVLS